MVFNASNKNTSCIVYQHSTYCLDSVLEIVPTQLRKSNKKAKDYPHLQPVYKEVKLYFYAVLIEN